VAGAMLKSAQFPFHSWLPDTMETPTPVSALMHAGIINAGGFLVIRMAPLLSLSHPAMGFLALFGTITALFGSLVMLTHSSIKRVLAFSTIAQMGFMMLECGLGAFSLALLHLVSHALYKAYAFLSSGNLNSTGKSFLRPKENENNKRLILICALIIAFLVTFLYAYLFQINWLNEPKSQILLTLFSLSISFYLWNIWSQKLNLYYFFSGIVGGVLIGLAYFGAHRLFDHYILSQNQTSFYPSSLGDYLILSFLMISFLYVLFLQIELPKNINSPRLEALYVHARNGFYFNTWINRWVQGLWPVSRKGITRNS
jgi:NAD(P)H-quinone oxidoreductase subunit 5